MSLTTEHPEFKLRKPSWVRMRDYYEGEEAVKAKGQTYLPATSGMILDGLGIGQLGAESYKSYLMRSVFPDYVKDAVEAYVGLLHQKPCTIELPDAMEPLREKATSHGESLELLLRRINEEQLVTGRGGLLVDVPVRPDPANPMPYIAFYNAMSIINWDDSSIDEGPARLNLVVLNESGSKRVGTFEWQEVSKYRVLMLGEPDLNEEEGEVDYQCGVFEADNGEPQFSSAAMKTPGIRGNTLQQIPFVMFNSKDITAETDAPPLMGLGRASEAIYRGEADYRQNLFMQGQDTFVVTGEFKKTSLDPNHTGPAPEAPVRTGAGSMVHLEAGGTAAYEGVDSNGLTEQRESLQNDRKRAETKSGQLIDATGGTQAESGEALKTRVAAQTATLHQIANTGAAALQTSLRFIATWMGEDPQKVVVTPNLEFADYEMTGRNLVDLMASKSMGAPISYASIHGLMVDKGLTKKTYEEELELIAQEADVIETLRGPDQNKTDPTIEDEQADEE